MAPEKHKEVIQMAIQAPTPNPGHHDGHYTPTPSEFHVKESPTGCGRYHVLNALDLIVCVHTTYMAAVQCAHGTKCARGYFTNRH